VTARPNLPDMTSISDHDQPAQGEDALLQLAGVAAAAIGTRSFHRALLDLAASRVPHRVTMAYHYWRFGAPTVVIRPDGYEEDDMYAAGYFRFDPFYRYWRQHSEPGVVSIARLAAEGDGHTEYMRTMVYDWGLADEIGVFLPSIGGAALGLFMDRDDAVYGDEHFAALGQLMPLLDGLHRAHQRYVFSRGGEPGADVLAERPFAIDDAEGRRVIASEAWRRAAEDDPSVETATAGSTDATSIRAEDGIVNTTDLEADFPLAPGGRIHLLEPHAPAPAPQSLSEAAAAFFDPDLSPRERDVMTQILAGCPNPVIARRLGISPDTVKKHRRKLYDKLDITTERELFTRFLTYVFENRP